MAPLSSAYEEEKAAFIWLLMFGLFSDFYVTPIQQMEHTESRNGPEMI